MSTSVRKLDTYDQARAILRPHKAKNMIEYRKSGTRDFMKIEGDIVVRVMNKEKFSRVDVSDNPIIRCDAKDGTILCSKDEFVDAYNLAMERIQTLKIS